MKPTRLQRLVIHELFRRSETQMEHSPENTALLTTAKDVLEK